jgi:ABC-type multidrug transport system fused ATPase/permease subunit
MYVVLRNVSFSVDPGQLMQGRTSVVIAHRLATIRNADKIIVLENGTIIEQGTHNELLANNNGLYKTLTELQFAV